MWLADHAAMLAYGPHPEHKELLELQGTKLGLGLCARPNVGGFIANLWIVGLHQTAENNDCVLVVYRYDLLVLFWV